MNKGTHFIGQPIYGQLINLLDKQKILRISREKGGERYVKHFDSWQHLVIMLYAVIKRFDSLREITDSMFSEARKLSHLGIGLMPRCSTLADANARRPESIFEERTGKRLGQAAGRTGKFRRLSSLFVWLWGLTFVRKHP